MFSKIFQKFACLDVSRVGVLTSLPVPTPCSMADATRFGFYRSTICSGRLCHTAAHTLKLE